VKSGPAPAYQQAGAGRQGSEEAGKATDVLRSVDR